MHKDDDTAFADNYAEREQAKALREQARAGGLRFEVNLPPKIADWLLERIERGVYAHPAEAVFFILGIFRDLEPHRDLRDELVRRSLQALTDNRKPPLSEEQLKAELTRVFLEPRPEPARWEPIQR